MISTRILPGSHFPLRHDWQARAEEKRAKEKGPAVMEPKTAKVKGAPHLLWLDMTDFSAAPSPAKRRWLFTSNEEPVTSNEFYSF
jgi:hypothetical protein